MPLNPLRTAPGRVSPAAADRPSPFRGRAEAALSSFRASKADLARQVRQGDLTVKVARQRLAEAVEGLKGALRRESDGFSPTPGVFLERLTEAADARRRSQATTSIEGLQRETNRLLRQSLIEQQLVNRQAEFEGRTWFRPLSGGPAAPSLEGLLSFHEQSTQAGDEAAREWARRQLEGIRSKVTSDEDHRRIDEACDRSDRVNPRIVAKYVEALTGSDAGAMETFVAEALAGSDANACCAAFVLAREAPEGMAARWVRQVLDAVGAFPDASLNTLRAWEADARASDGRDAREVADHAIALAEAEARTLDASAPTEADLRRQARFEARPVAAPHEPIGLNLARRGQTAEEFAAQPPDAPEEHAEAAE